MQELTNSITNKKRTREECEEELVVTGKKAKTIVEERERENVNILNYIKCDNSNNRYEKNENYRKINNISSEIYHSFNKNDVLHLLWKITAAKENFYKINSIRESFVSKRNDTWKFELEYKNSGKGSQNLIFRISCDKGEVKKYEYQNKTNNHNHNPNYNDNIISITSKHSETRVNSTTGINSNSNISNQTNYLDKAFDLLTFDIDLCFQIISYKNFNFSIKDLSYDNRESKEIIIPLEQYNTSTNVYSNITRGNSNTDNYHSNSQKDLKSNDPNNLIIVIEISIHKNFLPFKGYTGIINEAATCYMSSMLQTLNIIGSFKKAVFEIPTSRDDYNSVSLSMQRLFYELMKEKNPVSIDQLVKSFGWGREEIFVQHDVQEFNLLLSEVMEKKMKGTSSEGIFSRLFEGKLVNYIRCLNVDYKSEKIENFNDLQLTVKGCENIYQSLDAYTEEETLDNTDKYYAEGFGKQTAKKGIRFLKFPSVLILQLKRFEYYAKKEAMVKINDYFEFYEEINLSKYCVRDVGDSSDDAKYTLHSVVVHQGNANSGHYYAYIRCGLKDLWVQFNDEIVQPADKYEVFENNFGGSYNTYKHKSRGEITFLSNNYESNAYILVYIKNSERDSILSPISLGEISPLLINRFELEKVEEKKLQLKKLRTVENMNIILFSKENVENHLGLGILNSYADFNIDAPLLINKNQRIIINFPKYFTINQLIHFISIETNIPMNLIHLYLYENGEASNEDLIKQRNEYQLTNVCAIDEYNDKEENTTKNIYDLTNNGKNSIIAFFIFVADDGYKLFASNTDSSGEDYNYNDKVVFISRDINNYKFYKNEKTFIESDNNILNRDNNSFTRIIFMKELENKNILKIKKIFSINLKNCNTFNKFNNILRVYFPNWNIPEKNANYAIESRFHSNINNSDKLILNENNFFNTLDQCVSIILIPLFNNVGVCQAIDSQRILDELYDTIYIDIYCEMIEFYAIKKLKLNLRNITDENQIKKLIFHEIRDRNLFNQLINTDDHYFIDSNRKLTKVDENFLRDILTIDHIEIESEWDKGQKFWVACKEIPLLKYLNQKDCRIEFNINIFIKNVLNENFNFFHEIILYDQNNNRINNLSVIFPRKYKRCRDMIDYLRDFLFSFTKHTGDTGDYFFILQNPKKSYIYQLLTDNNCNLLNYESKADYIECRLQYFPIKVIENFNDPNYYKIFVIFLYKNKLEPIVIYLKKSAKLYEIKFVVTSKLKFMKNCPENLDECNLKYFTAKISESKILKDMNLQQCKEDETIENIFRDCRVYNILLEIINKI